MLDSIGQDAAHGIGRLALRRCGHMGVGVQREARAVVAQHPGDRFDVHAVLQGHRGEGMPLWHNKDKSDNHCIATG